MMCVPNRQQQRTTRLASCIMSETCVFVRCQNLPEQDPGILFGFKIIVSGFKIHIFGFKINVFGFKISRLVFFSEARPRIQVPFVTVLSGSDDDFQGHILADNLAGMSTS